MKKYLVIRENVIVSPDVAGQFDNEEDANNFAKLSKMADPQHNYWVYEQSK